MKPHQRGIPELGYELCPPASSVSLLTHWISYRALPYSADCGPSPSPNVQPPCFKEQSLFPYSPVTVHSTRFIIPSCLAEDFCGLIGAAAFGLPPSPIPPPLGCVGRCAFSCLQLHSSPGLLFFLSGYPFSSLRARSVCPPTTSTLKSDAITFNCFLLLTHLFGSRSLP